MSPAENSKPRVPGKPFPAGVSGNPGGRPKSTLNKTLLRILAQKIPGQKFTHEDALVRRAVLLAIGGDKDMINFVWDRLEGKAPQTLGLGEGLGSVKFTLSLGDGGDA